MTPVSRRNFLKIAGGAGTGLVLGFELPAKPRARAGFVPPPMPGYPAQEGGPTYEPNAYLEIAPDGTVTVQIFRSEMGQGVETAFLMIVADELEADWAKLAPVQARPASVYGNQVTADSRSISLSWDVLRAVAAAARMMLIEAAAQQWGVDAAECRAETHTVVHEASGQSLGYGELAEAAAALPVPGMDAVTLKDPADFKFIGQRMGQFDNPDFVTGAAHYCSDIRLDGMLYATIARCPVFRGTVARYDDSAALAVEGVQQVAQVGNYGVAVIADSTWAALKGREALEVTWDEGENATFNSEDVFAALAERAHAEVQEMDDGTPANVIIDAGYMVPYLAHASMEPMCCVAHYTGDALELWAPTQHRQDVLGRAAETSGLGHDRITVHVPLLGGGFGRRVESDFAVEAILVSMAANAPIKLFWSREDDIQHDYYHPLTYHLKYKKLDPESGSLDSRQRVDNIPTGPWRSVDNFPDALVNECFQDEVAHGAGYDLIENRRWGYGDTPRGAVMERAVELSGWNDPAPDGHARGIAVHSTFGVTHVAQVHEVSVADDGTLTIHRIVCVVDCGRVINPDMAEAQIEGGIVFALSAALGSEITIENGRAVQSNFHNYPIVRFDEMPPIEITFMESDEPPQGLGEMGVPTTVPALLNAIYNLTGKRIRRIPIRAEDLRAG
ncbi:xanthine dehydrogenase family protein molybdopterin-binding subunit [Aggregatilinea lenta]|uniref:xanthine dehydrogenase family protein molybdopterin-binding subunit n=1 Tax=Aggregatilinea lenta TaxID=913108 RepID=UPI000E5AC2CC|nr:molybdopterin cofactor-binding domain-containing protein [Aggregatilinea lenta]